MADVFFSYARTDRDAVRRLYQELEARDREVWVDWEDIPPTAEFMTEIYAAIEAADSVVFFLSPASLASRTCRLEVEHAQKNHKRLIPVVASDVPAAEVPDALARLNWIFGRPSDDASEATETLVEALDTDLDWVRSHTRLLTRALEWEGKGGDGSLALRGGDLKAAEDWLARSGGKEPAPTEAQTSFIVASRALAVRRQRLLLGGVGIALIVALVLAFLALTQRNLAQSRSRVALARQLGAEALAAPQAWPQRSNLLAVEAIAATRKTDGFRVAAAEEALRRTLAATGGLPLDGHEEQVNDVAFSPDGRWLASGGANGKVFLRSTEDPGAAGRLFEGHEQEVLDLAFSSDGRWLASGSRDGTVRLWPLSDRDEMRVLEVSRAPVYSIAFDPGGRRLAATSNVEVWMTDLGEPKATPAELAGSRGGLKKLAFSPNGSWLAAGASGRKVFLWRLGDPSGEAFELEGHAGAAYTLAFSPNGELLASASVRDNHFGPPEKGGEVRVWDLAQSPPTPRVLTGHLDSISALAFSADGSWLVSASWDRTARLWRVEDLDSPPRLLDGHSGVIRDVAFDPGGHYVATAAEDRTVLLWELDSPEAAPAVLAGHESKVHRVRFSPSGEWLLTAAEESRPRLWPVANPSLEPEVLRGHERDVLSLAYTPDGRLFSGGTDATLRVWGSRESDRAAVVESASGPVWDLASSPDGRLLAAGAGAQEQLWKLDPSLAEPTVKPRHRQWVLSVAFSPEGDRLVSAWAQLVLAWDPLRFDQNFEKLASLPERVESIDYSRDGRWFGAATGSSAAVWLRPEGVGDPIFLNGHADRVLDIAFGPKGELAATASADQTVRLWPLSALDQEPRVLRGYEGAVNAVAIGPGGRWLAAGGDDPAIRLWDLADPDSEAVSLRGHRGAVTSLAFSPDGKQVASASRDGTVREWRTDLDELLELACRRAGRQLTESEWRLHLGERPYRATCESR